jgi:hypothetical protein
MTYQTKWKVVFAGPIILFSLCLGVFLLSKPKYLIDPLFGFIFFMIGVLGIQECNRLIFFQKQEAKE